MEKIIILNLLFFFLLLESCGDTQENLIYNYKNSTVEASFSDAKEIKAKLKSISLGFLFLSRIEALDFETKEITIENIFNKIKKGFPLLSSTFGKFSIDTSSFEDLYQEAKNLLHEPQTEMPVPQWDALCSLDEYLKYNFARLAYEYLTNFGRRSLLNSSSEILSKIQAGRCKKCKTRGQIFSKIHNLNTLVGYLSRSYHQVYTVFYHLAEQVSYDFLHKLVTWERQENQAIQTSRRLPKVNLKEALVDLTQWSVFCEHGDSFKMHFKLKNCCSLSFSKNEVIDLVANSYKVGDLFLSLIENLTDEEECFLLSNSEIEKIEEEDQKSLGLIMYDSPDEDEDLNVMSEDVIAY